MHEWALAEAVIATVIEESRKEGLEEIAKITLKIGELQQMDTGIFEFALNEIAKVYGLPLLTGMKIELETERAIFKCRICGREWKFSDTGLDMEEFEAIHFAPEVAHAYVRCPSCKSPDFEVVQGRGVLIKSIKGSVSAQKSVDF
ncbi:MAG TPA: hydrogenase nickel incorporation protein HypA [Methanophagales archaeon]|nr:hydrogenase nickel incorporation protein HypA [Methanophagales archaeon]